MLVIEDDEDTRLLLGNQLSRLGYEPRFFDSAEAALPSLEEKMPKMILLDRQLPGMNGIDLCRRLRADPLARRTYIILMTATDDPETVEAALEAGANDYLIKPVTFEALRTRIIIARQKVKEIEEFANSLNGDQTPHPGSVAEELGTDLKHALSHGEMSVFYQPIFGLRIGPQIEGLEALLRWTHPRHGSVSPARFIPLAERFGIIEDLTEYVLKTATRQMKTWQKDRPELYVSVNVSANDLQSERLLQIVDGALKESGLDPDSLQLEVTETSAMQNLELARKLMDSIHERGLRVAIDDFGTGYSSLAYLQNFRFNVLKIDRSFTKQIPENRHTVAITEALLSLASRLKVKTVVEGVETEDQFQTLKNMGFRRFQGYLFSRPVPADDIPPLIPPLPL